MTNRWIVSRPIVASLRRAVALLASRMPIRKGLIGLGVGILWSTAAWATPEISFTCTENPDPNAPPDCTRTVDVYYGTLTPSVGPARSFVEFSNLISSGLSFWLSEDPNVDARIRDPNALPPWVATEATEIEWVLELVGSDEVFPAETNLINDYNAAALALGSETESKSTARAVCVVAHSLTPRLST